MRRFPIRLSRMPEVAAHLVILAALVANMAGAI